MASIWCKITGAAVVALATLGVVSRASAVIIGPGTGTQNTTQPPGGEVWSNLGKIGIGGGVYLGDRWVLTAVHLDPIANHSITFYPTDNYPNDGATYQFDLSTVQRLFNPDNTQTDLALVRLVNDPGLPTLNISTATPAAGTAITLSGFGVERGSTVHYQVNGSNWTPVASGGNYSGYSFVPEGVFTAQVSKRWGTNTTNAFTGGSLTKVVNNNQPGVDAFTTVFGTDFTAPGPGETSSEAIGVSGDSGGAAFSATSPNTLLGLMLYQDTDQVPPNQPNGTAIYGNVTDVADLSLYRSQLIQITGIPEPAGAMALAAGVGLIGMRRRRRK